jgi:pyridoxine 5-phosphate synthase
VTKLSVNVNKIATLRNTRAVGYPDLIKLSRIALESGAAGITVHPRPDERHIRASDILPLAKLVREFPGAEFNIEGNPFEGAYVQHCREARPDQCTLVPDSPGQATSDHGWNLKRDAARVREVVGRLKDFGSRVSLFMDADVEQIRLAKSTGADRIELYTEPFARDPQETTAAFVEAARVATEEGLGINAGHDLTLENLPTLLGAIASVQEVSIGHALISDALELGLAETVRRYCAVCRAGL